VNAASRGRQRRTRLRLGLLGVALLVGILLSLGCGAVSIPPAESLAILAGRVGIDLPWAYDDRQAITLTAIRLPRVLTTALVGAAWACAGMALQARYRTPLADPALVGIGAGAALGAAVALAATLAVGLVAELAGTALVALGAVGGALAALVVVHRVATASGRAVVGMLLIAGMALTALFAALTALVLTASREPDLGSAALWSLGSLSGADGRDVVLAAAVTLPAIALLVWLGPRLDALALGETEAGHLGIEVPRLTIVLGLSLSLLTGVAVAVAGVIAFVGLVIPSLTRAWVSVSHRSAMAGAALLGAVSLLAADVIARTAFGPVEMPIGVITTVVGTPFFLALMLRQHWLLTQ
jgi:iron complex transport system permease protein